MKKRLIRISNNKETSPIEHAIGGITNSGRKILRDLESLKFKIEQATRISGNNPDASQKIGQNSDMIDKLMSALYSVCFNLDNIELVPLYDNDQINIGDDAKPDNYNNEIDDKTEINNNENNENNEEKTDGQDENNETEEKDEKENDKKVDEDEEDEESESEITESTPDDSI